MDKDYHDAWFEACSKRLYGAMVVMKILVFDCDIHSVKDVAMIQSIHLEYGKI